MNTAETITNPHFHLDDYSNTVSVEPQGRVVGQPFTLADSFYDAHAGDVFLQRKPQPISVEPPSPPVEVVPEAVALVPSSVQYLSPEQKMEQSFRIPVIATLVFVVTMIAIYYMGGQVGQYYAPVVQGGKVEFVGRQGGDL